MARIIIILVVIVGLGAGMVFLAQNNNSGGDSQDSNSASNKSEDAAEQITFAKVQEDIENGAKFYDVRTPEEFAESRFVGAENWPVQDIEAGKYPDVEKDTKIYVHCRRGVRAGRAVEHLNNAGFTNVINLGGLTDVEGIGGTYVE